MPLLQAIGLHLGQLTYESSGIIALHVVDRNSCVNKCKCGHDCRQVSMMLAFAIAYDHAMRHAVLKRLTILQQRDTLAVAIPFNQT